MPSVPVLQIVPGPPLCLTWTSGLGASEPGRRRWAQQQGQCSLGPVASTKTLEALSSEAQGPRLRLFLQAG